MNILPLSPIKNPGGMEVENEESQGGARQRQRYQGHKQYAVEKRVDKEDPAGDDGDPSGKAVHVVDEVEGVGDANNPENGHGNGQDRGEHLKSDARVNGGAGRHDLSQQLCVGGGFLDVVDEPHQKHEASTDEDANEGLVVLDGDELEEGHEGGRIDGHPTEEGRLALMPPIGSGRGDPPSPKGDRPNPRGQSQRNCKGQ